jgi:hypothetical protein
MRSRVGCTYGDDSAIGVSAFGTHVDQPVGGLDDVEVVLGHQDRVVGGDEAVEDGDWLIDMGNYHQGWDN